MGQGRCRHQGDHAHEAGSWRTREPWAVARGQGVHWGVTFAFFSDVE